ncbi:MAG TPA: universal stress protein [Dehalococcoidia bacterium]|nr:universal stress protein [Dehalococcoidia bacterium]
MMYHKVLVPLDKSQEAARVLDVVKELQVPGAEVILLQVIPPMPALVQGEHRILGAEREEAERATAMSHLKSVAAAHIGHSEGWRYAVVVSRSVVQGIVDFAVREKVDLIAMYTHDRKGLAKLIKGSVAEKVLRNAPRNAPIEVRVFRPRELAGRS